MLSPSCNECSFRNPPGMFGDNRRLGIDRVPRLVLTRTNVSEGSVIAPALWWLVTWIRARLWRVLPREKLGTVHAT